MLRKIIFWLHLSAGVMAGIAIAIMSITGAVLAFEKELVAWAERDARRVEPPGSGAAALAMGELLQRVRAGRPDIRITSIALSQDPRAAVPIGLPGNTLIYANPYTGELREGNARRLRSFMRTMQAWHVRLNFAPGPGNLGRTMNSAANAVFLFLCVSGLVLWWPRVWNARALRPSYWFVRGTSGRARDWNWHNVFGFWFLPVLIVLTASGVVLSYRWANQLVFRLAGEEPPAPAGMAQPARARPAVPSASGPLMGVGSLMAKVVAEIPDWRLMTLRFNPPLRGDSVESETVTAVVRSANQWPLFANTTVTLDARTGSVRQTETFAHQRAGQRARRWLRLLHTGEALGWPGQLVAGLACLGGVVLVWTGVAMAWRRFFGRAGSG